jgi:sterol desaturase/sphingolipid hydroxylase (fatty acid hydroxylase superfamily)
MTLDDPLLHALRTFGRATAADAVWYAAAAGALWVLFYVLLRRVVGHRKVVPRPPGAGQISREVATSVRSIAVFGLVTAAVVFAQQCGYTRLYRRVDDHGWAWFAGSIAAAVVLHDAYFYWSHRLLHHPRVFRLVHRAHHTSTNPTPWAAYSFSLPEALVQAGIGPLLVFTLPMHGAAFAAFMAWQIGFNVLGHCGYEIFPRWFLRTWAGKVLNTPTHHTLHHEKVRGNYGLYFNVWDRLLGTNHPDYEARFERATTHPAAGEPTREAVTGLAARGPVTGARS